MKSPYLGERLRPLAASSLALARVSNSLPSHAVSSILLNLFCNYLSLIPNSSTSNFLRWLSKLHDLYLLFSSPSTVVPLKPLVWTNIHSLSQTRPISYPSQYCSITYQKQDFHLLNRPLEYTCEYSYSLYSNCSSCRRCSPFRFRPEDTNYTRILFMPNILRPCRPHSNT
jgi:hypothetical protein